MAIDPLYFKSFLASTGLSTRRFGDACGVGKTTIHRLAQPGHGGLTPDYVRRITPRILDACRLHLERAGAGAGEVHRRLTDIFGDDFRPMINHRTTLSPAVLEFFGLARDPFAAPRSPGELFTTPEIEGVYAHLLEAVRYQGFICVMAPVGAGKTVLKNRLIAEAGSKFKVQGSRSDDGCASPHVSKSESLNVSNEIQNPKPKIQNQSSVIISPKFADMSRLTAAGIVAYTLEELGIKPRRSLVLAQKQLEFRLAELAQDNTSVALCFDECHHLNDRLLTALKNFYELGTGGFERYLGLVLFGQPQFAVRLSEPRFREIAERLACLDLPPFPAHMAEAYLAHCLQNARHTSISDCGSRISDRVISPSVSAGLGHPESSSNPRSEIPHPKSLSSPPDSEGVAAASADGVVGEAGSDLGPPSNPQSEIRNPQSDGSVDFFPADTIRLIAARASTPLGIANAAATAMTEAYRMGERTVLARFVRDGETGPKAMRIGKV